jgi:hypothetical protein
MSYKLADGSIEQYIESTKYLQWEDGMYVMLDSLKCDYEKALVEDSLRSSRYFKRLEHMGDEDCMGVLFEDADYWFYCNEDYMKTKLTREQALYIATGETECTK